MVHSLLSMNFMNWGTTNEMRIMICLLDLGDVITESDQRMYIHRRSDKQTDYIPRQERSGKEMKKLAKIFQEDKLQ